MVTAYVERNAVFPELKQLIREKKLTLIHFPYDFGDWRFVHGKKWGKYLCRAESSRVTADTSELIACADTRVSEVEGSHIYNEIKHIVGNAAEHDVRHLDASCKSKAHAFLTKDKTDIVGKRVELERLTGVRIFHSDDDRVRFLQFVENHAPGAKMMRNSIHKLP